MTQAAAPTGVGSNYPGTGVHPDLLPVGTEVCGFRLLRHVATGSFGSVWQVQSMRCPGNLYALKFSLYGPEEHAVADARAEREVQLLRQAAHENVLRVVSTGRWQHPDKGLHYVVLQWVEGGTLWQWAAVTRPHTRQVVRLCQKLARALQRAHEAGVVHRDVKPDNVLVRAADGEPFLSDFGVGSARGATPLTLGVAQPGTLPFHSPQMLATHLPGAAPYQAQPADDWYSLGVVLYVLLTEVLPYPEHQPVEVLAQWVARRKPVPPHQLNPRVPPALGQVALKLLSAEPHQRYPDGQAVCSALEQALATAAQPEAPLQPAPAPAPHAALTLPPTTGDGPLARDPEVLGAHVFREEEDPDEERLDRVRALRDTLLRAPAQSRPPRVLRQAASLARQPRARRTAAAAVLLAGVVLASWAVGRWSNTPPDMAASAASPRLAPPDASPPKEGHAVKTPPSPTLPSPPAVLPKAADSRTLAALCAAGLAAACASVPLRPTQQPCPPKTMAAMQQRNWEVVSFFLDPNSSRKEANNMVPLRPGPIISSIFEESPNTSKGLAGLLYGQVFFAEDGRIVIHYTEVELPSGERVPVCFAVRETTIPAEEDTFNFDVQFRTAQNTGLNLQTAERVRVLPD
ncbi:MAG TPA: serine/threonine-protein kinase [Myxococcaceae bacterium]|jgi:serine/threonine-protein kinase